MTYRIVFTPSAKEDLRETRDWYDKDGLGLGNALLNEVLSATNRIASNPEHFAKGYGEIRQMILPRFPYVVSFRVRGERVSIPVNASTSENRCLTSERLRAVMPTDSIR